MIDLRDECDFVALSQDDLLVNFDCGDDDLNEFFNIDAIKYQEQMLGQTYFFRHLPTRKVTCACTLAPDGMKMSDLPNSRRKKVKEYIPHEKPLRSYPAYLIAQLHYTHDICSTI
jgi:hypothetical protein